jgi:hypothetical protein
MPDEKGEDAEAARKKAAESLQRQIDELVSGKAPANDAAAPRNLRDFLRGKPGPGKPESKEEKEG